MTGSLQKIQWPLYGCMIFLYSCIGSASGNTTIAIEPTPAPIKIPLTDTLFESRPGFIATHFTFPVGPPKAKGYYNAQKFGRNTHLGDDWNGVGGGNSDFQDPIYTIGNGYVISAADEGPGWGLVIRILHKYTENEQVKWVESLYAHLDEMLVKEGDYVSRQQQIGTMGTADGLYPSHLHLEIRDSLWMPVGGGYSSITYGYLDPTAFIKAHLP